MLPQMTPTLQQALRLRDQTRHHGYRPQSRFLRRALAARQRGHHLPVTVEQMKWLPALADTR